MSKTTVTLDRERTLKFDVNALVAAEEKTGRNWFDLAGSSRKLRFTDVRALLWAGCLHEDPDLTVEDAGRLIKRKHVGPVCDAIAEALHDFFGEQG
jgi:hypothetical protein